MTRRALAVLCGVALWWSGCGNGSGTASSGSGDEAEHGEAEHGEAEHGAVSNEGPKLATEPVDAALATTGKNLFSVKGCTACHAFGTRVTGPDLAGVTARRTRGWTTQWLQRPDEMLKTDPIARELFAQYATPMPNLHLTSGEVNALIEYMKQEDASRPQ